MKGLSDKEIGEYLDLAKLVGCGKGAQLAEELIEARMLLKRSICWLELAGEDLDDEEDIEGAQDLLDDVNMFVDGTPPAVRSTKRSEDKQ